MKIHTEMIKYNKVPKSASIYKVEELMALFYAVSSIF